MNIHDILTEAEEEEVRKLTIPDAAYRWRKRKPRRSINIFRQHPGLVRSSIPCIQGPVGTEHVRWVQSSLNQILGLRLRINGIMSRVTRKALRDFQENEGLQVDGIAGPETERALIAARSGQLATPNIFQPEQEQFLGSLWRKSRRRKRRKHYRR